DGRERKHIVRVLQRTPTEHVAVEVRRPLEVTHVEHEMSELTDLHGWPPLRPCRWPARRRGTGHDCHHSPKRDRGTAFPTSLRARSALSGRPPPRPPRHPRVRIDARS